MKRLVLLSIALTLVIFAVPGVAPARPVQAAPDTVTIAGDLDTALGCANAWDPTCAAAHLTYDAGDDVWQSPSLQSPTRWTIPAGNWNYKAALNDSWNEN